MLQWLCNNIWWIVILVLAFIVFLVWVKAKAAASGTASRATQSNNVANVVTSSLANDVTTPIEIKDKRTTRLLSIAIANNKLLEELLDQQYQQTLKLKQRLAEEEVCDQDYSPRSEAPIDEPQSVRSEAPIDEVDDESPGIQIIPNHRPPPRFIIEQDQLEGYQPQRRQMKSKGEAECCYALEKIFRRPFTTVRPKFLKNPETGRNLELDCYNAELKVAVEYNGTQHYEWPNFLNQTKAVWKAQIRRDILKRELCDKESIYLITVPDTVRLHDIEDFIRNKLPNSIGQKRG